MKTQKLLVQKGNIVDIAIDYGDGYILHVNANSGLVSLSKIVKGEKEHLHTILLEESTNTEPVPQE